MAKIVMVVKNTRTGNSWEETYVTPPGVDPGEWAHDLIRKFNSELRPTEVPRALVTYWVLDPDEERLPHKWEKVSLVTEADGTDRYHCANCGIDGVRYGSNPVRPADNFSGPAFADCVRAQKALKRRQNRKRRRARRRRQQ